MYLHIVPTLYHLIANKCRLESVAVPELDFEIKGEALSSGKPYPNKRMNVGMQKGRKAMIGLILQCDKPVSHFTTISKWGIEDVGVIEHQVKTIVMDSEFDLVSQYMYLSIGLDERKPRLHCSYHNSTLNKIQPMMESYRSGEAVNTLPHDVWDNNILRSRKETLLLHSLQTERLSEYRFLSDRIPQLSSAIRVWNDAR